MADGQGEIPQLPHDDPENSSPLNEVPVNDDQQEQKPSKLESLKEDYDKYKDLKKRSKKPKEDGDLEDGEIQPNPNNPVDPTANTPGSTTPAGAEGVGDGGLASVGSEGLAEAGTELAGDTLANGASSAIAGVGGKTVGGLADKTAALGGEAAADTTLTAGAGAAGTDLMGSTLASGAGPTAAGAGGSLAGGLAGEAATLGGEAITNTALTMGASAAGTAAGTAAGAAAAGTVAAGTAAVEAGAIAVTAGGVGAAAAGTIAAEVATGPGGWALLATEAAIYVGVKYGKPIIKFLLAVIAVELIVAILAVITFLSLIPQGNPARGVASNGYVGGPNFIAGDSCAGMTDQLNFTAKKQTVHLTLSATQGQWSPEDRATDPGYLTDVGTNALLSFNGVSRARSDGKRTGFTNEELKYYVTMRWPSQEWTFGQPVNPLRSRMVRGATAVENYADHKIIIYNIRTKKAVVGISAETGPAPNQGIADANTQQQQLWGTGYQAYSPQGYTGRIGGGPKVKDGVRSEPNGLGAAIDARVGDNIIMGFATDQNLPLGPTSCNLQHHSSSASTTTGDGSTGPLAVPGVKEGKQGDCGHASVIMVTLFYNQSLDDPTFYDKANKTTTGPTSCVLPEYINKHNSVVKDEVRVKTKSLASAITSVTSGDPVVIYTSAGSIFDNTKHIFVLVGYDKSTDTFWVNNPNIGSVEVGVKVANGKQMTRSHLESHLNEPSYGSTLIMRQKYVTTGNGDVIK
jgi:hypothetical protein